jgi:sigma-B regulation protein RsbU (phosphoserine phosphatase)
MKMPANSKQKLNFLKNAFPSLLSSITDKHPIDLDLLNDFIETEYGRYLKRLFMNEWELLERQQLIEKFEEEHADSLAMIMENESQKILLKELNKKLNELLEIHEKDMKMASNVQRLLHYSEPPIVANYDIALHYQPCASVSGDLYDFYIERETNLLSGILLADVSGHGIAPGLLTIMARPIFYREFIHNRDMPLNDILDRINNKLIRQMEASENYLTGVLLRFNGTRIEYCNSAHPDILHTSARTGLTTAVTSKKGSVQGSLMGISAVAQPFSVHYFEIESGDIVLVYTDCLIECKDSNGAEFSEHEIAAILAENNTLGARGLLNILIEKMYAFAGSSTFKDDLSVILLKKK